MLISAVCTAKWFRYIWKWEWKSLSCVQLFAIPWISGQAPSRLLCPWNSPGQNMGVGSHSLLQGIFPIQGLNPGLPHGRQILYQLSYIYTYIYICICCSVTKLCLTLCDSMDCSMPGSRVLHPQSLLKLMSLSQWCHPTISSSVIPFSSCLQSCPASGSFLMSQLFASGSQSIYSFSYSFPLWLITGNWV